MLRSSVLYCLEYYFKLTMIVQSSTSNKCLSLRQWALCFSLVIFSITGIFTTFAGLGKIHADHVWDLVNADIQEEHHKLETESYMTAKHLSMNEAKLRASKQLALVGSWILYICTWVGCLNVSAASLLIYGIAMKSPLYMVPWILLSVVSYLSLMVALCVIHSQLLPGVFISFGAFVSSLIAPTIFMLFWHVIIMYYNELVNTTSKLQSSIFPTSIKATSGYVHTLSCSKDEKQLIV